MRILWLLVIFTSTTVHCTSTNEQLDYVTQFTQADEQRYQAQFARCDDQITDLIGRRKLCRYLTYFYSIDCMTLRSGGLMHLITQRRIQGWNLATERIPVRMEDAGVFYGVMQVRGRPPVASLGWMCTQRHDASAWNYDRACYLAYDNFEGKMRLGLYTTMVPNTGLFARLWPEVCPHELDVLRFDLSNESASPSSSSSRPVTL